MYLPQEKPRRSFSPGDRVAFSAGFLRSTGQIIGDAPRLRGTVISVSQFGDEQLCIVLWLLNGRPYPFRSQYHDDGFGRIIAPNLTLVENIGIDSAKAT